jgi:prolyl 4-hydroxylase
MPKTVKTLIGLAIACAMILVLIFFPMRPHKKNIGAQFKTKLIGDTVFLDDGTVVLVPRKAILSTPAPNAGDRKSTSANVSLDHPPKAVSVRADGAEVHVYADPEVERQAQITELRGRGLPLNGHGAVSRRIVDTTLVANKDYFADYDVNAVNQHIHADNIDYNKTKATGQVQYIDLVSPNSKWVGRWLSKEPSVAYIPEFLTDAECDALVADAKKRLFRSQVAVYKNAKASPVDQSRTSDQAWLAGEPGSTAAVVIQRVMQMMSSFPPSAHEQLQILRYDVGQHYFAHNDYFAPELYGKQSSNRAVTVFLYLNDVEEGGETQFPRADGKPPTSDFSSCTHGLRMRPLRRSVVVFYDMKPNGDLDPSSLHGGCDVKKGMKWGGTLWIRTPTP